MYKPPVKSPYRRIYTPKQEDVGGDIIRLISMINRVEDVLMEVEKTKNSVERVEKKLSQKLIEVSGVLDHILSIQKGEKGDTPDINHIAKIVLANIRQPRDGVDANPEEVAKKVMTLIPKVNEEKVVTEVLRRIPKPKTKTDIKIIQDKEKVVVDPLAIIDQIMSLPEDKLEKLKFKQSQISGLEQTIKAFRNQLARGYLHGGGAGAVTVYSDTPSGAINGSNVTYTLSRTPKSILTLTINGQYLHPVADFSVTGNTITLTSPLDSSLSGKSFTCVYV